MYLKRRKQEFAIVLLTVILATSVAVVASFAQSENRTVPLPPVAPVPPVNPQLAMKQLQLRILEAKLNKLVDSGKTEGEDFEELMARIRDHHEYIFQLHEELAHESNREAAAQAQIPTADVGRRQEIVAEMQAAMKETKSQQLAAAEQNKAMKLAMKEMQQELQNAHEQLMLAREKEARSASGEEYSTNVYRIKHTTAGKAAELVLDVLGDSIKLSTDDRTNSIVARASDDMMMAVSRVLEQIDQPSSETVVEDKLPRSVAIRVFWLSQGSPHENSSSADSVLPKSVCKGLAKVGLHDPHLVSQAVTSLALTGANDFEAFQLSDVRSTLFGNEVWLNLAGHLRPIDDDRLQLNVETSCSQPSAPFGGEGMRMNTFSGSVVTPLDHYVILGTTSYATGSPRTATSRSTAGRGRFGGGRGGYGGEGEFGGEFGRREAQESENDDNTPAVSQLAYVVQIVKAETYAAETYDTEE